LFLLVAGLAGTGYYVYTLSDQFIYQKYENWAFDQQIGGRTGVTFADYVREKTPFGFLVGEKNEAVSRKPSPETEAARPATGSLLGRVTIGRLNLAAIVREGVDAKTLSIAVGHVPSTALPGKAGNFAIAAHRDTLFRALKDIKKDDLISFQSPEATYTYQVAATKIVKPSDVSVLRADGGGLIDHRSAPPAAAQTDSKNRLLTMITCYPFYYVGSAPKRFIVQAQLISEVASAKQSDEGKKIATAKRAGPVAAKSHPRAWKRPHKRRWHALRATR
jgi:sortase A